MDVSKTMQDGETILQAGDTEIIFWAYHRGITGLCRLIQIGCKYSALVGLWLLDI